jgi:hypothetical protein
VAVKQVFETYVYDLGMSSVVQTPFVMTRVNGRHGEACGGMPQGVQKKMEDCAKATSPRKKPVVRKRG